MADDWSNRHTRLRFWLLLLAAIIFVVARRGILQFTVTQGWPVHAEPPVFCFVLFVLYLYVLGQFVIRTRVEKLGIARHVETLQHVIERLGRLRTRSSRAAADGDADWSGELPAGALPVPEQASPALDRDTGVLLRQVREQLADFDIAAVRLELATSDISGGDDTGESDDRAGQIDRLKAAIRDIAVLGQNFEQQTASFEEAAASLQATRAEIRNSAAEAARRDELARRLSSVEQVIAGIARQVEEERSAYLRERLWSAVYLPVFVSLLLIALSADAVVGGILSTGVRLAAAMSGVQPG